MLAPVRHAKLHLPSNLLSETHAARAVNATAHLLHTHKWTNIFVKNNTLFFFIARGATPVTHGEVLELALSALIANWTVKWVIDE